MGDLFSNLAKAIHVEEIAAELYLLLSDHFPRGSLQQESFAQLAREEQQHAQRIKMLRTQYISSDNAYNTTGAEVKILDGLVKEAQTLRDLISRRGFSATSDEAISFMVALEKNMIATHAQLLAAPEDKELRAFFEDLARQDSMHMQLLEDLREEDG